MAEITLEYFESLFKAHHKSLSNQAYNLVRDTDTAKDIVQEVFLKFWKNRNTIEVTDQIENYLRKATSHTALNHLRNQKKVVQLDQALNLLTIAAPSGAEQIGFTELEIRVQQSIDRLPPKCKTIFLLSRHEGMKFPQIAESLGLSVKTVENQMTIALSRMREDLRPYLTPELILIALLSGWLAYLIF